MFKKQIFFSPQQTRTHFTRARNNRQDETKKIVDFQVFVNLLLIYSN